MSIIIWWHKAVLKHEQWPVKVTPPLFDPTAQGILVKCMCGKEWAL